MDAMAQWADDGMLSPEPLEALSTRDRVQRALARLDQRARDR